MNNLLIKIGALGDVLRTTSIFRVLKGDNYLLSDKKAKEFVTEGKFIKKIINYEDKDKLLKLNFNLVLNLEEDKQTAEFVNNLKFKKLIGIFYNTKKNIIDYTKETNYWFDMSLSSRLGIKKANELKLKNRKSYQEILFSMIGKKFKGEEYILKKPSNLLKLSYKTPIIAIEKRSGIKWPMKIWPFYDDLAKELKKLGLKVYFLRQRKTIQDYIKDINKSHILISGDTFSMHLGLALKKKIITIFTCTSPWEIYDYGRMIKIINPKLKEAFYRRDYDFNLVSQITVDQVLDMIKRFL
jgi:heptosyltransferase-2